MWPSVAVTYSYRQIYTFTPDRNMTNLTPQLLTCKRIYRDTVWNAVYWLPIWNKAALILALSVPIYASTVGEMTSAVMAKAWLLPFADKRVGVQVTLWDLLTTRAIPQSFCDEVVSERGAVSSLSVNVWIACDDVTHWLVTYCWRCRLVSP